MENQHRMITGYTELTQEQIDLINEIKAHGKQISALVTKVRSEPITRYTPAQDVVQDVNDARWVAIAETHFQQGLMALARSVTNPDFF